MYLNSITIVLLICVNTGKLKESWTLVYPRTEISFFNNVVLCDDAVFELTGGTCDSELCEGWESCVYNSKMSVLTLTARIIITGLIIQENSAEVFHMRQKTSLKW